MVTMFWKAHRLKLILFIGALMMVAFLAPNHVYADASSLIGMVNNGDIYVKVGSTSAPWTYQLTTGENATQLEMYGDRVAFVDGSGNLWLKQGLTSPWFEEMGNVQSYALTEDGLLVLQSGGDVWYKAGSSPTAQWDSNLIASDGAQVYLSPSQMVIIDTSGDLLGKELATLDGVTPEGPDGAWYQIAQNASSAAITDSRLVYLNNVGSVYGKDGPIWSSWWNNGQVISTGSTQVALSGNMYCWIWANNQQLSCMPNGFSGGTVFGVFVNDIDNFTLAPGVIVLDGAASGDEYTYLRGMDYSKIIACTNANTCNSGYTFVTSGWNIVSTTGTEITTNQE